LLSVKIAEQGTAGMKATVGERSTITSASDHELGNELAQEILRSVGWIHYGSMGIVILGCPVIQVEHSERVRLQGKAEPAVSLIV
jgi:hypothetical protein